jgi:hypothetical protein
LALVVVPLISVDVRKFGRFLCELSNETQDASRVASKYMRACMRPSVHALFIKNNMVDVQFIFST